MVSYRQCNYFSRKAETYQKIVSWFQWQLDSSKLVDLTGTIGFWTILRTAIDLMVIEGADQICYHCKSQLNIMLTTSTCYSSNSPGIYSRVATTLPIFKTWQRWIFIMGLLQDALTTWHSKQYDIYIQQNETFRSIYSAQLCACP